MRAQGTSYGAPCELENVLARIVIDRVPSIEMVRFVNSGTEACLSVLRLMRAYTKRDKVCPSAYSLLDFGVTQQRQRCTCNISVMAVRHSSFFRQAMRWPACYTAAPSAASQCCAYFHAWQCRSV